MSTKKSGTLSKGLFGNAINVTYGKKAKHLSPYFPEGHLSFVILGASGCGKSTTLLNIVPNISNLSQVIICSRVTKNDVYKALENYCKPREIEFVVISEPESGETLIEEMLETREDGKNSLIVFDDFTRNGSARSDPYTRFMTDVSKVMRNYGCYNCFITQSATDVPTLVRNNATVRIVFQMGDMHAIRSFKNDFIANSFGDEIDFKLLYSLLSKKPHSFLMLCNPDRIFYHNGNLNNEPMEFKKKDGRMVRVSNEESTSTSDDIEASDNEEDDDANN